MLAAFGVVLAACVLSFGLTGVCLVGNFSRFPLVSLPTMPYSSALLFGLALLALTVACVVGSIYYFAFICQLFRSYGRFRQNALSTGKGEAALPPLPIHPQLQPRRRLRMFLIISVMCFNDKLQHSKKASQSSRPQTRKISIIFSRDLCVRENTSQAASVEFWCSAPKLCAQQTAILLSKTQRVFRQPKQPCRFIPRQGCFFHIYIGISVNPCAETGYPKSPARSGRKRCTPPG